MRFSIVLLALLTSLLAACGVDITSGSQFAGQSCFADGDCRGDLICVGRVCTPTTGSGGTITDGGAPDGGDDQDGGGVDFGLPPDGGSCVVGEASCVTMRRVGECVATDEGPLFIEFDCPAGTDCSGGRCVGGEDCEDLDGDGYGRGCPAGPDCEDRVRTINPGVAESCATPYDDDCDMLVNEGCDDDGCCEAGCGDLEFCSQCSCRPYDPSTCQFQNQPCNNEGIFENGLFCGELGDELRCIGVCDRTVDEPASTCPEPNSVCAFGDDQSGACLSGCDPAIGCGEPGLGCLPLSGAPLGGTCVPVNDANAEGESCDDGAFFDCQEGLLCIDLQGTGVGECRQACRAFGTAQSDCDSGANCLPLTAGLGLCFPDNGLEEGDRCMTQGTTCSDDAVGCYPGGGGGLRCQRLCRLEEGNTDCPDEMCRRFSMENDELGVCR